MGVVSMARTAPFAPSQGIGDGNWRILLGRALGGGASSTGTDLGGGPWPAAGASSAWHAHWLPQPIGYAPLVGWGSTFAAPAAWHAHWLAQPIGYASLVGWGSTFVAPAAWHAPWLVQPMGYASLVGWGSTFVAPAAWHAPWLVQPMGYTSTVRRVSTFVVPSPRSSPRARYGRFSRFWPMSVQPYASAAT